MFPPIQNFFLPNDLTIQMRITFLLSKQFHPNTPPDQESIYEHANNEAQAVQNPKGPAPYLQRYQENY